MQDVDTGRVILIDKPLHWTSFDVVKKLKYALKIKKIGHAGTLDPLATGLLILCTGKMTKQINTYQAQEKEYEGTIVIGKTTPSYDLETSIDAIKPIGQITHDDIVNAAAKLTGEIEQTPPLYSAVKVNGKRAYKSAREGEMVKLKPRVVVIKQFDITEVAGEEVKFRVVCSKGTYIRSLAHDLGQLLGVGAHLSQLRRTRIGDFNVKNAHTIEQMTSK